MEFEAWVPGSLRQSGDVDLPLKWGPNGQVIGRVIALEEQEDGLTLRGEIFSEYATLLTSQHEEDTPLD